MSYKVPKDAARHHLKMLRPSGLTLTEIGKTAHISRHTLWRILTDYNPNGETAITISRSTERKILALPPAIDTSNSQAKNEGYRMPPKLKKLAACRGMDPSLFFLEGNNTSATVKAVCARCPIRQECLEEALANDEPGIWGGTSEHPRRQIQRDRKKASETA